MPQHTIETPVTDYTGTVAGVRFTGGRGETDDENAVAYFQRHGYTVTPFENEVEVEPDEPPVGDPSGDSPPANDSPAEPDSAKPATRRTPAK